jgi:hypothetical protein
VDSGAERTPATSEVEVGDVPAGVVGGEAVRDGAEVGDAAGVGEAAATVASERSMGVVAMSVASPLAPFGCTPTAMPSMPTTMAAGRAYCGFLSRWNHAFTSNDDG